MHHCHGKNSTQLLVSLLLPAPLRASLLTSAGLRHRRSIARSTRTVVPARLSHPLLLHSQLLLLLMPLLHHRHLLHAEHRHALRLCTCSPATAHAVHPWYLHAAAAAAAAAIHVFKCPVRVQDQSLK